MKTSRRFAWCLRQAAPHAAALTFAVGGAGFALADGYSNAEQARAQCEKLGKAGSPAELKKCCGDQILVASLKEQQKLEARCAAPRSAAPRKKAGSAAP